LDLAASAGLRVFAAIAAIVVIAAVAAGFTMQQRSMRTRLFGHVVIGAAAGGFVLNLQSGMVGTGIGGAVLAAGVGAIAVLLVVLFRSV
jgi:hypothetical protein